MIFDISGNVLSAASDINGSSLSSAYDIAGNLVFGSRDYDSYTIETLFQYQQSNVQGFAIYNDVIVQAISDYGVHFIDMNTHQKIRDIQMDVGHGNSCQFSDEFYSPSDDFPLFYIRNTGIWVYRFVGTTSTLVKKYSFSPSIIGTYVAGFGIDSSSRVLYTASYTEGTYESKTGLMRICKWDMDDVTDNEDGTFSMSLLSTNDFSWFDRFEAVQGCCFHDGYFYISCGLSTNTQQYVVLIDPSTLSIDHIISLGLFNNGSEIEGCAWVDDDYLVVGLTLKPYVYKKITFGIK